MRGAVYSAVRSMQRRYWRVVRPRTRGARAIVVDDAGRVLVVRHTYAMDGSGSRWYLPGGGVKRRETPAAAVRRELLEEVGVSPTIDPELFGVYTSDTEGKRDTITLFVVRSSSRADIANAEIADSRFVDPASPPDLTSPATRRRLAEFVGGAARASVW